MRIDSKEVMRKTHPHPISSFGYYVVGFLIAFIGMVSAGAKILILIGALVVVFGEMLRTAETFYVLKGGVAWQYIFFSTARKFSEYEKIQNVEVHQNFLENILGIGSIKFDTAGLDRVEISFNYVVDPYGIEKIVRDKMKVY